MKKKLSKIRVLTETREEPSGMPGRIAFEIFVLTGIVIFYFLSML